MTTRRDVFWTALFAPGLEHLVLVTGPVGVEARSIVLIAGDTGPVHLEYTLTCDPAWRVRSLAARTTAPGERAVTLLADGAGRWTDDAGWSLAELEGCLDVDIAVTPFTNTLPIRRLGLRPGEATAIRVAYVSVPWLDVTVARQRYTCLATGPDGAHYRYENLGSGFTAELAVDLEGLVTDYPGLFRRADTP